jgi:hypothetical protein
VNLQFNRSAVAKVPPRDFRRPHIDDVLLLDAVGHGGIWLGRPARGICPWWDAQAGK